MLFVQPLEIGMGIELNRIVLSNRIPFGNTHAQNHIVLNKNPAAARG